jgi:hypothetical protein
VKWRWHPTTCLYCLSNVMDGLWRLRAESGERGLVYIARQSVDFYQTAAYYSTMFVFTIAPRTLWLP